jgi:hypothetical protein
MIIEIVFFNCIGKREHGTAGTDTEIVVGFQYFLQD